MAFKDPDFDLDLIKEIAFIVVVFLVGLALAMIPGVIVGYMLADLS